MLVEHFNRVYKFAAGSHNSSSIIRLLSFTNETRHTSSELAPPMSVPLSQTSISKIESNALSTQSFNPKFHPVLSSKSLLCNMHTKPFAKDKLHFNSNINQNVQSMVIRNIHTSVTCSDVMEFFDKSEYWGALKVRVGRSWLKEELRLKSNEDLHKLWFVLLKERNMLLTMQTAYKEANEHMPNEERVDKVEISMENLEEVVRERNRAYFELETGGSGERERVVRQGPFGMPVGYKMREHAIPFKLNSSYRKMLRNRFATCNSETVRKFVRRYMEKKVSEERTARMKQLRRCANLLKRFPESDEEALKEKFPLVDINAVKRWKRVLGHHHNYEYDVYLNTKNPYGNK